MCTQTRAEMFLHYELRYAILSRLMEKGVVAAPVEFNGPENNRATEVGNLVFMIASGTPAHQSPPASPGAGRMSGAFVPAPIRTVGTSPE